MQSITTNRQLMQNASVALQGKWAKAAGAFFLLIISAVIIQMIPIAGPIIWLLLVGPYMLGFYNYALRIARGENVELSTIFSGFNDFGRGLLAYLLTNIYILLWSLLLIIPGIMAAFAYTMTYFILIDNPDMGVNDAISLSRKLMTGNRWKIFCLSLRFLGWFLLAIFTFGIAGFWVYPYMQVAFAKFYDDVREQKQ